MVKSSKATKKFAKNHLANVIKLRKEGKERRQLQERIDNKQGKRKRTGRYLLESLEFAFSIRPG
jgi:hypothetical protein